MVGGYHLPSQVLQPLAEIMGHPFCQPSGVNEDKGRSVLADEVCHPVIDVTPNRVRRHRT